MYDVCVLLSLPRVRSASLMLVRRAARSGNVKHNMDRNDKLLKCGVMELAFLSLVMFYILYCQQIPSNVVSVCLYPKSGLISLCYRAPLWLKTIQNTSMSRALWFIFTHTTSRCSRYSDLTSLCIGFSMLKAVNAE